MIRNIQKQISLYSLLLDEKEAQFFLDHGCKVDSNDLYSHIVFPGGTTRTRLPEYDEHLFLIVFSDKTEIKEWHFADGRSHFLNISGYV